MRPLVVALVALFVTTALADDVIQDSMLRRGHPMPEWNEQLSSADSIECPPGMYLDASLGGCVGCRACRLGYVRAACMATADTRCGLCDEEDAVQNHSFRRLCMPKLLILRMLDHLKRHRSTPLVMDSDSTQEVSNSEDYEDSAAPAIEQSMEHRLPADRSIFADVETRMRELETRIESGPPSSSEEYQREKLRSDLENDVVRVEQAEEVSDDGAEKEHESRGDDDDEPRASFKSRILERIGIAPDWQPYKVDSGEESSTKLKATNEAEDDWTEYNVHGLIGDNFDINGNDEESSEEVKSSSSEGDDGDVLVEMPDSVQRLFDPRDIEKEMDVHGRFPIYSSLSEAIRDRRRRLHLPAVAPPPPPPPPAPRDRDFKILVLDVSKDAPVLEPPFHGTIVLQSPLWDDMDDDEKAVAIAHMTSEDEMGMRGVRERSQLHARMWTVLGIMAIVTALLMLTRLCMAVSRRRHARLEHAAFQRFVSSEHECDQMFERAAARIHKMIEKKEKAINKTAPIEHV